MTKRRCRVALLLALGLSGCSLLQETWLSQEPLPDRAPREVQATFAGNRNISDRTLRQKVRPDMIGLSQGFDAEAASFDSADAIAAHYHGEGFPDARASYRVAAPVVRQGEPDLVVVHFEVDEGPQVTVERLELVGNTSFPTSELLPLWSRRNSGLFGFGDPLFVLEELRAFAAEVREFYRRRGHLEVEVDEPEVVRPPGSSRASVTLRIREGRLFRFGTVNLAPELRAALGDAQPQLPEGQVFSTRRTQELLLSIRRKLLQRGHPRPKVGIAPLPDVTALPEPRIDLDVRGDPGPVVKLGEIVVVGNERTSTGTILDELGFKPGDRFNGIAEESAVERLYRSGLFQRVSIEHGEAQDGTMPMQVRVDEIDAQSIELLVGYGSYEQLRGGVRYEDRNLFGTGREFAVEGRVSQRGQRASTTLTDRDLFDADVTGTLGLEIYERQMPSYTDRAFGATTTLRRELVERVVGRVGYSYLEHSGSNQVQNQALVENYTQGTVFTELRRDARDNMVLPRSGGTVFVRCDFTNPAFGADVDFNRLRTGASWILELRDGTGLALNAEAGWLWPNDGSGNVPLPERFFCGGYDSVRSFEQDQVGPKDAQGNPLGGEFRNLFNIELRQRLWGALEASLFADAGNIGARIRDYGFSDMRYALGIGLRLQLPIGPVRVDAGWNPDQRPGDESWVIHVAIGYPF